MRNLALRESFTDAKNQLYCLTGCGLYIAGRAYDPECSQIIKSEETSIVVTTLADIANPLTRYLHHHVVDDWMEKAATGDHAPKPDLREAVTGLAKIATQQIPRLTTYTNQLLKGQIPIKNPVLLAGGIVALFSAACLMNPNTREHLRNGINQTTSDIAYSANKLEDKITQAIEARPSYTPKEMNI